MSAFERDTADLVAPPEVVVMLKPEHFLSSYQEAPCSPFKVGLHGLGFADKESIVGVIESDRKRAEEAGVEFDERSAALVAVLAIAICSPNDARAPHDAFSSPNALLPIALKPSTMQWLFDELERHQVATSPIFSEADDDDIAELIQAINDGALKILDATDGAKARRVRRYLDFVACELGLT